jgi:hypothetical protein
MDDKTKSWATKLMKVPTDAKRVETIYQQAFIREPTPRELQRALHFNQELRSSLSGNDKERELKSWQALCRVVLASSEFVHVD